MAAPGSGRTHRAHGVGYRRLAVLSGMLFIESFAECENKAQALGANLIGGLVGGVLQAVTFVVGVKALLLIVAGLYVAALMTRPKRVFPPAAPEADGQGRQRATHGTVNHSQEPAAPPEPVAV